MNMKSNCEANNITHYYIIILFEENSYEFGVLVFNHVWKMYYGTY